MSDILELGKAVNEKCQSKDGSVDHRYWAFRSVELLPALIAETERLRFQAAQIEALKEKLVEERSDRILRRQHDYEHNYSFTKSDALDLARQQLKAEMQDVAWDE